MKLLEQKTHVKVSEGLKTTQFKLQMSAKMAGILSKGIYSDAIKAIIRELSTNACDSHTMAGKKSQPIEVTLPTSFSPQFIVQDRGVGLSEQQMDEVYTTYGASDKEDSNDYIGMIGIGSKSVFSYNTKSASIESIHDGIKSSYSAYISESNMPVLTKLGEVNTTEGNGVKITIPVNRNDIQNFVAKAKEIYSYFEVRPIIKGQTLSFDKPNILTNGNNWELRDYGSRAVAIMGNCGYPIQFEDSSLTSEERKMMTHPFFIKFDIGDLDVEVSREGLQYDLRTRSAITAKFKLIRSELSANFNKELDKCENLWTARCFASEKSGVLYDYVNKAKLKWKNQDLYPTGTTSYIELPEKIGQYATSYRSLKYFKPSETQQVSIRSSIMFVVNDVDKGLDSRVLNYASANYSNTREIYVITPSQEKMLCDTLGIDPKKLILGSSLPKPTPKARTKPLTTRGSTSIVMTLQQGKHNLTSYYTNVSKDLNDGGKYFEFNTFRCVWNGKKLKPNLVWKVKTCLDTCGVKHADEIYAIKTTQLKKLAKAKKPWISYLDWAFGELDTIYSKLQYTDLDKVQETLDFFGMYCYKTSKYVPTKESLFKICKYTTQKDFIKLCADIESLLKVHQFKETKDSIEQVYNQVGRKLPTLIGAPVSMKQKCVDLKSDYYDIQKKYPLLTASSDIKYPEELGVYLNAK